jgi:hypothetical protein
MPDFLNLNWLFGKGTRRRKNKSSAVAIDSESGLEHYKSGGPNSNVQVRRKSRSATASEHRPNKRRMSWVSRNENFKNTLLYELRKTKKQRNQKKSRKNMKHKK